MGGTFEEMFRERFPARLKKVKSVEQLIINFHYWQTRPVVTLRQRMCLIEEAKKMGLKVNAK